MEKRYQIFISSTFADLEDEREQVMKAILNLDCFPAGMELFPASNKSQFEFIKKIIDKSDYYVLIIAGRYGSEDTDGIGFTEKEYDYARENGIPIYSFIYSNIDSIERGKTDKSEEKFKKLENFILKVSKDKMCDYWENKDQLAAKVERSLRRAFEDDPRPGWVRGDNYVSSSRTLNLGAKIIKNPETVKDKVLLAIYKEYNKDDSNMKNISAEKLGLDNDIYLKSLVKLNEEALIKNIRILKGGSRGMIYSVLSDNMLITTYGISYLEKKEYI